MHDLLSRDEIIWLEKFNHFLREIQDLLQQQLATLETEFSLRVADPEDRMDDYEIEITISYILRKDDPDYIEDSDNILVEHSGKWDYDRLNSSDWSGATAHDFGFKNHCWLFHELYDHSKPELSVRDILRIGDIWIDIKPQFQYFFETPLMGFDFPKKSSI